MHYLQPQQIAPFSVLFTKDDAPPPFDLYDFEVISAKADFQLGYSYRDLEPRSAARRTSLGFVDISGRVRNSGAVGGKICAQ